MKRTYQNIKYQIKCDDAFKRSREQVKLGFAKHSKMQKMIEKAMKRGQKSTTGLGYKESSADPQKEAMKKQIDVHMQFQRAQQIEQQQQRVQSQFMQQESTSYQQQQIQQNQDYIQKPISRFSNFQREEPVRQTRDEIKSEYMKVFKSQMQSQFRSGFQSKGSIVTQTALPTISFMKSEDTLKFVQAQQKLTENPPQQKSRSRSRDKNKKQKRSSSRERRKYSRSRSHEKKHKKYKKDYRN